MAKKKSTKKHKFKYTEPSGAGVSATQVQTQTQTSASRPQGSATASVASKPRVVLATTVTSRDFSYVSGDMRRLSALALGLVGFELVIWYVMGHTGLGSAVYNLVKV